MHPEQRLIEKRKIALAQAHQQLAELEAKQAAAAAAAADADASSLLQQVAHNNTKAQLKTIIKRSPASSALPLPKTNDGISSGAVAERRLREKRQAILEKMMQETSSSSKE